MLQNKNNCSFNALNKVNKNEENIYENFRIHFK